ncbi:MAG: hypothetical protein DWI21_03285 [Planctomycetota bacterium]|nr:MAG: hypothetical protein DWI21_03285 [Planctomycetota bacterium]
MSTIPVSRRDLLGLGALTTYGLASAERLTNPTNQMPLKDWSSIGKLRFQPKPGSDLTRVIFAEFKWVTGTTK